MPSWLPKQFTHAVHQVPTARQGSWSLQVPNIKKGGGRRKRRLPPATPSGSQHTGRAKRRRVARRYEDIAYSEAELSSEDAEQVHPQCTCGCPCSVAR